jgi:hypothetical protein
MAKSKSVLATVQPKYRLPTFDEMTAPVPRVVNEAWLVLALRANAAASKAGGWLPWDDVELLHRAAVTIERLAAEKYLRV